MRCDSSGARPSSAEFWVAIHRGERSLSPLSSGVSGTVASVFAPSFTVGSEGGESRSGFAAKLLNFSLLTKYCVQMTF